ncbi:MAG: hypothetical protein R2794_04140 [Chitinophagales bacterium]
MPMLLSDAWKIYPFLGELVDHYHNLVLWKENKKAMEEKLPGSISKIDLENMRIDFERIMDKDEYLHEVNEIIAFALPLFQQHIHRAKDMYDAVESHVSISAVGIVPVNTDAGYLLFRIPGMDNTDVFSYALTIFEQAQIPYRGIRTQFVESYPHSILHYDEAIKSDLIRKHKAFPNPATYVVESKFAYPFRETLFRW